MGFRGTHSQETKDKIRATMKRKGIKPTVLPSREQCIANLGESYGVPPPPQLGVPSWNKGKNYPAVAGEKNGNWKGGKPHCADCGCELANRHAQRCVSCHQAFNKGSNHYKWKGGPDSEILRIRTSTEYKQWRMAVFRRDWFTCQMPGCGYKGNDIEANHIKPVRLHPDLILDVNNGITLCGPCHKTTRYKEETFEQQFTEILAARGRP